MFPGPESATISPVGFDRIGLFACPFHVHVKETTRGRIVSATGYTPQGAIKFPALGSLVAREFANPALDIPSYVHIGGRPAVTGGGFLGPMFAPFVVGSDLPRSDANPDAANLQVDNLSPPTEISLRHQSDRLKLLSELRELSAIGQGKPVIDSLDSAT